MMRKYAAIFTLAIFSLYFALPAALAEEILSWQECIKEAAKNHPDLIAAEEVVKQSEAEKKITASTLFPQVTAGLNASTGRNATDSAPANTADSYNYGVSGTQLIFDANKTVNNVKAAGENVSASKENFKYTSATVRYRLRSAFVNLLTVQENLLITQQIYDIRRSNLELITLRYESGLEHKGALLTAQADLASAQYQINLAKRNVEVYQRQLVKEMGRKDFSPMLVKGDFTVKDAVQVKPDFETLAKNNPSLLQIIAQKNSAEFGIRAAYSNFAPTLTGQAGANKNGTEWSPKGDQWNLGLALSMPIFEGGLKFSQLAQAKALFNQLQENERSTRDSLVYTLEQTWAALQNAMENVGVQKAQLIATEERSKIAQAQYSIGFISFDNWTIIEDNLVKAKSAYLAAESNALGAEASWIQAKGETLEYEK
ncbi:MAG: TolC family protein [Candidatus Omnitrophica bacterium]|jgi:outer membrane protein TolC|nr:TolC family protein [Candidatus Omnitrophota bacterium]